MTQAEVEAILGGPPGDYARRPVRVHMEGVEFRRWWIGDEAVIMIELESGADSDAPRRIRCMAFGPVDQESFTSKCRRLLVPW